jgi:hypothetical protein
MACSVEESRNVEELGVEPRINQPYRRLSHLVDHQVVNWEKSGEIFETLRNGIQALEAPCKLEESTLQAGTICIRPEAA